MRLGQECPDVERVLEGIILRLLVGFCTKTKPVDSRLGLENVSGENFE